MHFLDEKRNGSAFLRQKFDEKWNEGAFWKKIDGKWNGSDLLIFSKTEIGEKWNEMLY